MSEGTSRSAQSNAEQRVEEISISNLDSNGENLSRKNPDFIVVPKCQFQYTLDGVRANKNYRLTKFISMEFS